MAASTPRSPQDRRRPVPASTPARANLPAAATVPGRTAAFIWAVIALLCSWYPLLCVPLSILALVFTIRAFRHTVKGGPGRGLVIAALVISGVALAITVTLVLFAANAVDLI
jgi:hypothetical protein